MEQHYDSLSKIKGSYAQFVGGVRQQKRRAEVSRSFDSRGKITGPTIIYNTDLVNSHDRRE